MKSLRLLAAALLACAFAASAALACDAHKSSKGASASAASNTSATVAANAKSPGTVGAGCSAQAITYQKTAGAGSACTPEMAAACTPAMQAACASNPKVAAAMGCSHDQASATTAAVAASSSGKPKAAADDCCATKGAKGASATAVTASNSKSAGSDHCAYAKGATTATAAGMKCSAHANAVAHDCSACEDWMACEQDVRALGATAQVVSLKNGAMIVYTAETPANVKPLQTVIAKRNEKMVSALSGQSGSKLCGECKSLRGAMASGKLHREIVNVERGCMTLITSNDREVVGKIRAMTGQPVAMR